MNFLYFFTLSGIKIYLTVSVYHMAIVSSFFKHFYCYLWKKSKYETLLESILCGLYFVSLFSLVYLCSCSVNHKFNLYSLKMQNIFCYLFKLFLFHMLLVPCEITLFLLCSTLPFSLLSQCPCLCLLPLSFADLVVQCLRLMLPVQRAGVQSTVRELRSHMPQPKEFTWCN